MTINKCYRLSAAAAAADDDDDDNDAAYGSENCNY
jgi:hypothetical protein